MEDPKRLEEGLSHNNEKNEVKLESRDHNENEPEKQLPEKKKTKRVATLDAFRGLTVVVS